MAGVDGERKWKMEHEEKLLEDERVRPERERGTEREEKYI